MSGELLLQRAAGIVAERRKVYGEPTTSMNLVAQRWSLVLGMNVTAVQVALCLIDLKLARLSHDPRHIDSIADVAGYAAVLREVAK